MLGDMQPENGAGLFNCSTASVIHTGISSNIDCVINHKIKLAVMPTSSSDSDSGSITDAAAACSEAFDDSFTDDFNFSAAAT